MINFTKIFSQVSNIRIRSITDSVFKFALIILVLGVIAAICKVQTWVLIVLFSLGGLFGIIGLITFIYFSKKAPDYLRSEVYQLRKQSLELLGDKNNQIGPNIDGIISIASPFSDDKDIDSKNEFGS